MIRNDYYTYVTDWTKFGNLWSERENQQDATVRCLLSILSQHVSGIIIPIFRRTREGVIARSVLRWFCWMWLVVVVGRCVVGASTVKVTVRLAHNRYQPHPVESAQNTTCDNTRLGLLKMGIMMPETCWESIDNKHLTLVSCWFSLSLHNLLTMHGHRNLKFGNLFLLQFRGNGFIFHWQIAQHIEGRFCARF